MSGLGTEQPEEGAADPVHPDLRLALRTGVPLGRIREFSGEERSVLEGVERRHGREGVSKRWIRALLPEEREVLEAAGRELSPAANGVLTAVAEGAADRLPGLVAALSEKERRSCLPFLKTLVAALRDQWQGEVHRRKKALLVAGAGCHTGAAAVAQWVTHRDLAWLADFPTSARILEVLAARPKEWQGDVARRVAARSGAEWDENRLFLVDRLVLLSGCPVPADEGFVLAWMRNRLWGASDDWPDVVDGVLTAPRSGGRRLGALDRVRDDPFLDAVVPRLFEVGGVGPLLQDRNHPPNLQNGWNHLLAALCREGRLDREALLDGALARLLRPGRPGDLRGFRKLLDALEPTEDEYAARTVTLLRLLPDTPSPVAGHAQKVLARLDEAGRLEDEHLVDASASVLFRTEATLVRAQLSWLDRAARRDRSRAGLAALAAADAFGHGDLAVQERALNLVARHLPAAGDAVRPGLVAAAAALTPVLRGRAAEVLGGAVADDDPEPDVLPAVSGPRPMEAPPATAVEVAEEVNAIIAATRFNWADGIAVSTVEASVFERVLDGLVRHAHRDRDGLVHALEATTRTDSWIGRVGPSDRSMGDVCHVVAEILGEEHGGPVWRFSHRIGENPASRAPSPLNAVLQERLREVARMVVGGAPPFLLATPTLTDGRIDPAALVERIAEYERVGAVPGEVDLSQALLRVDAAACGGDVLARARELASDAGRRLTAWLEAGGLPEPKLVRAAETAEENPRWGGGRPTKLLLFANERLVPPCALAEVFARVLDSERPSRIPPDNHGHWPFVVPVRRELVALHLQPAFTEVSYADPGSGMLLLPALAEGSGAAGPALHLGLACGLGARDAGIRTAAVDALLVLAARGGLDPALLGRELAEATRYGVVTPRGLAESVREAARFGASGAVWTALSAALPALLDRDEKAKGLPDVLAVAAESAHRCGARGPVAEVSALAARKGSTRLLKEARRLRDALEG
ncbi:DUF6493 family protein [Actinorugispora endophytica]|uniref:Secreted protein n=1 Tax=Actinorugispora endophytica TaxID=1605990 RepID=A0A4R6V026_9ACTN|nr:DUF6493 family protein [Actinorugispora endophytica]TDQ53025.1 hypothetical protein EV190_105143 [Actinorugispora endophytica]